jgi:hypothetical protein
MEPDRWGKLVDMVHSISDENKEDATSVKSFNTLFPIPYEEIV